MAGGTCVVGGHAWWGACVAGGMHGRGHAWQGGMPGGGGGWGMCDRGCAWQEKRQFLLECILVKRI